MIERGWPVVFFKRMTNLPSLFSSFAAVVAGDGFSERPSVPLCVDHNRGSVFLLQNILCELGLQRRQLGIDFLELLLSGIGELRARPHEILVVTLEQITSTPDRVRVYRAARKALTRTKNSDSRRICVPMRGKFRRQFLIDLLPVGIRIAEFRFENIRWARSSSRPVRSRATIVLSNVTASESPRFLDFLQLRRHAGFDRRHEMLILNLIEGRVLIWQDALGCERIVLNIGGKHAGDLRSLEQRASKEAKT